MLAEANLLTIYYLKISDINFLDINVSVSSHIMRMLFMLGHFKTIKLHAIKKITKVSLDYGELIWPMGLYEFSL